MAGVVWMGIVSLTHSRAYLPNMVTVLQMVAIKRKDTGDWAIPGGMVDDGAPSSHLHTLILIFTPYCLLPHHAWTCATPFISFYHWMGSFVFDLANGRHRRAKQQ